TATSARNIEDLITETMLDVWRTSATITDETSVNVWIMRFAYAHVSKHLAWADVRTSSLKTRSHPDTWLSRQPDALRELAEVFAYLRVVERAVVYLVYSGHSRQDVAEILGVSGESLDEHLASSRIPLHPWFARKSHPIRPAG